MKRNRELKHIGQYRCYGNWSVIGHPAGGRNFRNLSDISQSPAITDATKTEKPPKYQIGTRVQNISCPLQENEETLKFKFELNRFLELIPDEPNIPSYVNALRSNSILDQLSHRWAQGIYYDGSVSDSHFKCDSHTDIK